MDAFALIPFCPIDKELRLQIGNAEINQTIWNIYPQYCRNSVIILLVVVGTVSLISLYLNCVTMLSVLKGKFDREDEKCTKVVTRKVDKHKQSIWRQKIFRLSLAFSGILSSVFLFPFIAAIGDLIFSKQIGISDTSQKLTTYKAVANGFLHVSVLSTIYVMIGYVVERWATVRGIQPDGYFVRIAKHDTVDSPTQERTPPKKTNFVQIFLVFTLIFLWGISIALSWLAGLPNSGIRFLLYGQFYEEGLAFPNGLIFVNETTASVVGIVYIIVLFAPFIFLILALGFLFISLLQVQARAKQSKYYHIALQATFPDGKECKKFQRYLKEVERKDKPGSPIRQVESNAKNCNSANKNPSSVQPNPEEKNAFSHKEEYLKQIETDRHLNCIADIQTDSIQIGSENETQADVNLNKDTIKSRLGTYKFPKPPNWLKLSTMKRCNSGSRIKVTDLTKCGKTISKNCAKAFFEEIDETKATIITCALLCLFILPLCGLIAIDMYSSSILNTQNSVTPSPTNASPTNTSQNAVSTSDTNSNAISKSLLLPNLAVIFVTLFIFSGTLPYLVLINWSPAFQFGTSRVFRRKIETKPYRMTTPTKRDNLQLRGDPNKSEDPVRNSWHVFFRNSKDISSWKPKAAVRDSTAQPQVVVNIDQRFAMDSTE